MKLKERAKKLKTDIPAVFLAVKDKDTPIIAKIVAGCTVAYALSPIVLIPDFIPVLGYLDDIIKLIPKNVMEKSRKLSEGMWENGKPKKWYFAVPIVIIWLLIIWLILKAVLF